MNEVEELSKDYENFKLILIKELKIDKFILWLSKIFK